MVAPELPPSKRRKFLVRAAACDHGGVIRRLCIIKRPPAWPVGARPYEMNVWLGVAAITEAVEHDGRVQQFASSIESFQEGTRTSCSAAATQRLAACFACWKGQAIVSIKITMCFP